MKQTDLCARDSCKHQLMQHVGNKCQICDCASFVPSYAANAEVVEQKKQQKKDRKDKKQK